MQIQLLSVALLSSNKLAVLSKAMKSDPYPKAPITEAIVNIQVKRDPEIEINKLREMADQLKDQYPGRLDARLLKGTLQLGAKATANTTEQHLGFVLTDEPKQRVAQLRVDGFSYSMLAPYTNWPEFTAEARKVWETYRQPEMTLTKIAVRYVNRIDIPLPIRDFRDFLRTYPELSSDMEPYLSGYFMQLQCPQPGLEAIAIVTQGMIPAPKPNVVSILLDIDLARSINLPSSEQDLWTLLERFRGCKNSIFEACITNRTRSLFT